MAKFMQKPAVPVNEVWLKNPDGRFVLVKGQHKIDEDGRIVFHKNSAPEYEYAIKEIGGWRLCNDNEIADAMVIAENDTARAKAIVEAGKRQRLLARGAVPVTMAPVNPEPGDATKTKGGK